MFNFLRALRYLEKNLFLTELSVLNVGDCTFLAIFEKSRPIYFLSCFEGPEVFSIHFRSNLSG